MKILIAEDDVIALRLLEATLTRQGHAVSTVVDGEEAWATLERAPFDVLITDYLMPRLDGFALARRLRERARADTGVPYLYIVLLTIMGGKTNLLSAIEAGVDDFMAKPFDADLLAARLHVAERILGLHEHIHRLEGLLPVCAWCKRLRDEHGNWQLLEQYLAQTTDVRVTHGICPECESQALAAIVPKP